MAKAKYNINLSFVEKIEKIFFQLLDESIYFKILYLIFMIIFIYELKSCFLVINNNNKLHMYNTYINSLYEKI